MIGWAEMDSSGRVYFHPLECDCHSTGGCDKCRPFILPKGNSPEEQARREYYPFLEPL